MLVDRYGNPVTRCFCGNPLAAPRSLGSVAYLGPRWSSFTANSITVITHQTTTVTNEYTIVDVHTGRGYDRPTGSAGEHDTVNVTVPAVFPPAEPAPAAPERQDDQQAVPSGTPENTDATGPGTGEGGAGGGAIDDQAGARAANGTVPGDGTTGTTGTTGTAGTAGSEDSSGSTGSTGSEGSHLAPAAGPAAVAPDGTGTPADSPAPATGGATTPESPSDLSGTPSPSATPPSTSAPTGTWRASAACDLGTAGITFASDGSYTAGDAAGGSWTRSGSTLVMTPGSGAAVPLTGSGDEPTTWSNGSCSLRQS